MAIVAKNITITDKDGNTVDPTESRGGGEAFKLIASGLYTATIEKVEEKTSDGKGKSYAQLYPHIRLHNDNGTFISRQQLTVGQVDEEGSLVSTGNGDLVWGGMRGARDFLTAVKAFYKDDEGNINLSINPAAMNKLVVKVLTSIGGYRRGEGNISPYELKDEMTEILGYEPDFSNQEHVDAVFAAKPEGLYLNNVIVKFYNLNQRAAEENGWYYAENGMVFLSEADYFSYVDTQNLENGF